MNGLISPDKIISVWMIVYLILYKLKLVMYNPIILFYIGLIFVIFGSFYVLIYGKMSKRFLMFIILNTLIKVIPIIILYKDKIQSRDVAFTFIFIIVYILYLTIRNEDAISLYKDIVINIIDASKGRQGYATKFMNEGIKI
jgi:hypothetical protein